ncbi:4-hydroxybenzoate octaprenyltransferase [Idiomarina tyrosinivorans]|uniref:4-hydroxybenzoate octaprenyltransferase n=1 Tax=Idiomarina tyrosinivorans TaxID=1445662 RepID=A0A432ZTB5_9GAMM|nr:4-hydroxybenzoate octaprenyltransferase [Idiomarina tyrosinivorans]RUO81160.1 4-hydroxybenzoate octaprenyltransferase [Idiomarina tyrosinivorans]
MVLNSKKLLSYWQLMRADRPIGTYLLAWPTIWALLIAADGFPPLGLFIIFMLGTFVMRSAGCVINDIADRNFDGHVTRTKHRPLATGAVTTKEALGLFVLLLVVALGLVLLLNISTIVLSIFAVAVAALYPFCKRWTHLPQVVLGVAFSFGIPMAFTAQNNDNYGVALLLVVANLLWTVAYDTEYAMADRDDDITVGIRSTALLFGRFDRLIIGLLQLLTLISLVAVGVVIESNWPYYGGLVVASALFAHQHWRIRKREAMACFRAFLDNHYVGMAIGVGLAISLLLD